jgi:hypothetical protein
MTREPRDLDAEIAAAFVLDDGDGPAPPISAARASSLVEGALAASAAGPVAGASKALGKWLALGAVVVAAGVAIWYYTRPRPEAPPIVVPEPPRPEVVVADAAAPAPPDAAPAPDATAATREPIRAPSEDELLARANAARADKRWPEAERLYRRVARTRPETRSAHVAWVAVGTLRLEQLHDAAGALDAYRKALAVPGVGALDEEARWGSAEAHRSRGDGAAEARALRAFLAAHPASPLAGTARARLEALGGTAP